MITIIIIILTAITSFIAFSNRDLVNKCILNPYTVKREKEYFRFLSSGFLHANWMHLIINMFVLYSFGRIVEQYYQIIFEEMANLFYIGLYLGGIIASDIPTYLKHKDDPRYASLGASGAVSAVLFASILFAPLDMLYIWGVLPIPAIVLGVLYLVYSAQMSKRSNDNINHDAHFYGAIFGVVYTLAFKPAVFLYFINSLLSVFS